MPPLTTQPTASPGGVRFASIVVSIRKRLCDVLELRPERVVIVADRQKAIPSRYPAENHLRVRPLSRSTVPDPGAGRLTDPKTRNIAIDIITRSSVDQAGSDLEALTKEGVGQLEQEDSILDALDLHVPVDKDGVKLVIHPMRETSTEDTARPNPGDGFLASTIYFQVVYIPLYLLSRT